jgi:hypothetical protein
MLHVKNGTGIDLMSWDGLENGVSMGMGSGLRHLSPYLLLPSFENYISFLGHRKIK